MASKGTCNHKRMRVINKEALFRLLESNESISRIELTKATKLDGTTITHLVRELIADGLVESKGYAKTVSGRPKELLSIKADGREVVSLQVEPHRISGGIVNLRGRVRNRQVVLVGKRDSQSTVLRKIRELGTSLLKETGRKKLAGVGLAYHGIVDRDSGIVLQSARFKVWRGVNISEFLTKSFKLPFAVEDYSRCKAIAEHWVGSARDVEDFVLLDLGVGIGCAVFAGGKVRCGVSNSAGELGHCIVVTDGRLCGCGMKGCLETVASLDSIEDIFAKTAGKSRKVSYQKIIGMANQDDGEAVEVVTQAGRYIGIAVSSLVNVLNPSHLIVCGELLGAGQIVEESLKRSLKLHTIRSSYENVRVIHGITGKDAAIIGAARLVLMQVL